MRSWCLASSLHRSANPWEKNGMPWQQLLPAFSKTTQKEDLQGFPNRSCSAKFGLFNPTCLIGMPGSLCMRCSIEKETIPKLVFCFVESSLLMVFIMIYFHVNSIVQLLHKCGSFFSFFWNSGVSLIPEYKCLCCKETAVIWDLVAEDLAECWSI